MVDFTHNGLLYLIHMIFNMMRSRKVEKREAGHIAHIGKMIKRTKNLGWIILKWTLQE